MVLVAVVEQRFQTWNLFPGFVLTIFNEVLGFDDARKHIVVFQEDSFTADDFWVAFGASNAEHIVGIRGCPHHETRVERVRERLAVGRVAVRDRGSWKATRCRSTDLVRHPHRALEMFGHHAAIFLNEPLKELTFRETGGV